MLCCVVVRVFIRGKALSRINATTRKTIAADYEKRRRLQLERQFAGIPVEQPGKARIRTVSESIRAYKTAYGVTHREKSQRWVAERIVHLERLLGSVVLMDLSEDRIRGYMEARLKESAGNRTDNMEVECLARAAGRTWRELFPRGKVEATSRAVNSEGDR